ncbi:hypothetical protein RMS29_019100 [Agrobacterium rosae]|uniref:Uncharacterized protein n=1 Tax=Agrobacterium rosae TaxID=1972867 RepID=A0ABU4VT87_9HYPH|nr:MULTISPECIES: hypothetical protein [Agrobacterium]MCM2431615.1 hypothetical protein [Agrobacterium rosae]MDX8328719.1 hypothetical protein [Agrobacterium rosae]
MMVMLVPSFPLSLRRLENAHDVVVIYCMRSDVLTTVVVDFRINLLGAMLGLDGIKRAAQTVELPAKLGISG